MHLKHASFMLLLIIHSTRYRLGPVNSNTVNSKFHLIQTFSESLQLSYLFNAKLDG